MGLHDTNTLPSEVLLQDFTALSVSIISCFMFSWIFPVVGAGFVEVLALLRAGKMIKRERRLCNSHSRAAARAALDSALF